MSKEILDRFGLKEIYRKDELPGHMWVGYTLNEDSEENNDHLIKTSLALLQQDGHFRVRGGYVSLGKQKLSVLLQDTRKHDFTFKLELRVLGVVPNIEKAVQVAIESHFQRIGNEATCDILPLDSMTEMVNGS